MARVTSIRDIISRNISFYRKSRANMTEAERAEKVRIVGRVQGRVEDLGRPLNDDRKAALLVMPLAELRVLESAMLKTFTYRHALTTVMAGIRGWPAVSRPTVSDVAR